MDTSKAMRIEAVQDEPHQVTILTTGARYVIPRGEGKGQIQCYQRLNRDRAVATITLSYPLSTVTVEHQDNAAVILHQGVGDTWYIKLSIHGDSLLEIYSMHKLEVNVRGAFAPDYAADKDGNVLLADADGGMGVYPYEGYSLREAGDYSGANWQLHYEADRFCRLFVSVFPPRPYEMERSYEERIAHFGVNPPWAFGAYPTDEMIEGVQDVANVLVLHCQIWQGKLTREGTPIRTEADVLADSSYCSYEYKPVDEGALRHVLDKAHDLGMRVIPYLSPTFSMASGQVFREMAASLVERYGFDGVYYDGVTFDMREGYELMRETRRLLGDKLIYLHSSYEPLFSRNVYCPFIDTYADFVLRGEHPADFQDEKYIRYVLSGYNTSNAIGFVCHCYYPADFVRGIIDKTLSFSGRFYLALPETDTEAVLRHEYFAKLDQLARAHRERAS